ncbi:UDP-N-acetylmuramyl pentapeptide synthase [Intrasporangium oryzae NRRL B-24470]|uniref:UDP-N-acetylmuramoyl-tripeptide--D-alanyl-D-alanine ligase n=1 Tax=Intrasporangium oryzae NRRL B-24470 TaxID=1386089 RepID=W9G127_9MICO|nr:UDP-N-acetylmuramoyl-tripeptide--D-alanyl-D-alanine ligase [Intrasporangium oryzae]EWS99800.1 UDP-N-acetylmuramyl pentapeptide synthase [Intrasporangium oryzae NRRL B-24470]
MIALTLGEVRDLTGGALHGAPDDEAKVVDGTVTTDSRECGPGGLYVARVGETSDGHAYVGAAAAAGAVAALTSRVVDGLPCIVVDDVQTAFGRLARGVIDRAPELRVIGITGSSGKTSTKDLLASVLETVAETVAPVNSLNGEIGVPLTVCRVTPTTRFLVAEMGARGIGHIEYLTRIAPPQVAIVLNVGTAHVGEFGSRANIARAKSELPRAVPAEGLAILNADDPLVRSMAQGLSCRVQLVGLAPDADVRAEDVVLDERGRAAYDLVAPQGRARITLRQSGAHHVGNSLAVAAAALELGLSLDQVAAGLAGAGAVSRWRMEITERPDGVVVVNDAYNANPDSMRAAIDALCSIAAEGRRWAVLGEMLELGDESAAAHEAIGAYAAQRGIDHVVAVGEGARAFGAPEWVADIDAAHDLLAERLAPGDVVLLKSSRDSGLRWLGDRLAGIALPQPGASADGPRGGAGGTGHGTTDGWTDDGQDDGVADRADVSGEAVNE